MKRKEAVELYAVLREIKSGLMNKEALVSFILMRMKLKGVFDEFEKARVEISEQTKPEEYKDGDSTADWDKAFRPVMDKWLEEEVGEIDTYVLSTNDFAEIVIKNDLAGGVQDLLFERIVKM